MMDSLESICFTNLYNSFFEKNIKKTELTLLLYYTFKNQTDLFTLFLTDILMTMNKDNIDSFFELYNSLNTLFNREQLNRSICISNNNSYFKHYRFGQLLLYTLSDTITYTPEPYISLIYKSNKTLSEGTHIVNPNYKQNFNVFTADLFTGQFNWSNCIVAGGSIYKILQKTFNDDYDTKYKKSDIDIFVYGQTKKKKEKVRYLINYFIKKLKHIIIINKTNVLTIYSKHYHRDIQIIVGNYRTPLQILNDFDLSHLQLCYNGTKVQLTPNCYHSLRTQTTSIMKCTLNANLYKKIKVSGLSLVYKNEDLTHKFLLMEKDLPEPPFSITDEFRNGTITEIKNNVSDENDNREASFYSFHALKNGWSVDRALCAYDIDYNMFKYIYLNFSGSFNDTNFYMTPVL